MGTSDHFIILSNAHWLYLVLAAYIVINKVGYHLDKYSYGAFGH